MDATSTNYAVEAAMPIHALSHGDLDGLLLDGVPVSQLHGDALHNRARACGMPRLGDEMHTRVVLGMLITQHPAGLPPGCWLQLREEARGLLLLAVRREGKLSATTAAALNVLNQGAVVEKYKAIGNRWTIAEGSRDAELRPLERARKELEGDSGESTGAWLSRLAETLDAPVDERPWYTSKIVLWVLGLSSAFVLFHLVLLLRVLKKVHSADNRVLLYPVAGLGASACVGLVAIAINKLSEKSHQA